MMIYEKEQLKNNNGTLNGITRRVVGVQSFTDRINLSCAVR